MRQHMRGWQVQRRVDLDRMNSRIGFGPWWGWVNMQSSTHPRCAAPFARWITSSCAGLSANTKRLRGTQKGLGVAEEHSRSPAPPVPALGSRVMVGR